MQSGQDNIVLALYTLCYGSECWRTEANTKSRDEIYEKNLDYSWTDYKTNAEY